MKMNFVGNQKIPIFNVVFGRFKGMLQTIAEHLF